MKALDAIARLSADFPRHKFKETQVVDQNTFGTRMAFLVDNFDRKLEWPITREKETDLRAFYGKTRLEQIDDQLYLILSFDVRMHLISNGALHV
jgi:hypothetical protein